MTTWTTFETIDEMAQIRAKSPDYTTRRIDNTFWVDALGNVQRTENQWDRPSRFRVEFDTYATQWRGVDLEQDEHTNLLPMYQMVRWIAGRVLYGAWQYQRAAVMSPSIEQENTHEWTTAGIATDDGSLGRYVSKHGWATAIAGTASHRLIVEVAGWHGWRLSPLMMPRLR